MEIVFSDEKLLLVHPFGAINTIAFMLPIKKAWKAENRLRNKVVSYEAW